MAVFGKTGLAFALVTATTTAGALAQTGAETRRPADRGAEATARVTTDTRAGREATLTGRVMDLRSYMMGADLGMAAPEARAGATGTTGDADARAAATVGGRDVRAEVHTDTNADRTRTDMRASPALGTGMGANGQLVLITSTEGVVLLSPAAGATGTGTLGRTDRPGDRATIGAGARGATDAAAGAEVTDGAAAGGARAGATADTGRTPGTPGSRATPAAPDAAVGTPASPAERGTMIASAEQLHASLGQQVQARGTLYQRGGLKYLAVESVRRLDEPATPGSPGSLETPGSPGAPGSRAIPATPATPATPARPADREDADR